MDLDHLPLLPTLLRAVGLLAPLRRKSGNKHQRRLAKLPLAVFFLLVQLAPYAPMLLLRRCKEVEESGALCSSFTRCVCVTVCVRVCLNTP